MGRRLADATKACRTRRTRGETALRFFRVLVEATGFFLAGVLFDEVGAAAFFAAPFFLAVFFVAEFFGDAVFDGVLLAGALAVGGGASPVSTEDWAAVDDKEPSENRNKVPAKNATAKLRTQTLPTGGSWHP
jgi:hypothetical protein